MVENYFYLYKSCFLKLLCVCSFEKVYLGCTYSSWIFGKNDVYSSKLESKLRNQELQVGHASGMECWY